MTDSRSLSDPSAPAAHGSARDLPDYDDLPIHPDGQRCAWGYFGVDDSVGLLNLETAASRLRGAALVREGRVFALTAPTNALSPPISETRSPPRHHVAINHRTGSLDDVLDNFFPQGSSQWDSLAHVAADATGQIYYNGATREEVLAGSRNTIDNWARRGIAGRGILLDLVRRRAQQGRPYAPGTSEVFDEEDLEAALSDTGLSFECGDMLVIRTGFLGWYLAQPSSGRRALRYRLTSPGLAPTEGVARWLWNQHVSAVISDNFAVEVWPRPAADSGGMSLGSLHRVLIGMFGMALGELWVLDELADHCAADGVWEFFLVSAPMNQPGGIGSPANALAIK
jgi:hypothetical protein